MSSEKQPSSGLPFQSGRSGSPTTSPYLKQRGIPRSTTFSDNPHALNRRRSSFFSEGLSETHRSFRSSTDDLLLPRVKASQLHDESSETSHWHSIPLGLALLPAVGGVFFQNGSAVITDITLLGLAAIFLNWSLRLPWEWYHAAQASAVNEQEVTSSFDPIYEEAETDLENTTESLLSKETGVEHEAPQASEEPTAATDALTAQRELRIHELAALLACFIFPMLGAWLLHAIRAQLSRPSEGLVSNYNLTIFLLMAELRPLSHLMKMIQRRTLYLRRRANASTLREQSEHDRQLVQDLNIRLEELEAHVASNAADESVNVNNTESPESVVEKLSLQATTDVRKTMQPELDALNRAMRRYEKRMTISAIQVEARLQDLETRMKDVVVLAAAAQRNADKQSRNYIMIFTNWLCAFIVVPVEFALSCLRLPGRLLQSVMEWIRRSLGLPNKIKSSSESRLTQKMTATRPRGNMKRAKPTS